MKSLAFTFFFLFSLGLFAQPLEVHDLRNDFRTEVMGSDNPVPRFSWKLRGEGENRRQTAYQLQVYQQASLHKGQRKLIWDSGRTASSQSHLLPYAGPELQPQNRYHYRVRVWDGDEKRSRWSSFAFWETGLMADWQADWITPAWPVNNEKSQPSPMLRRGFSLEKPVAAARLYISSLGLYEAHINGQRVGDAYFTPGWTALQERVQYQTFDVTELVQQGKNAIGVVLGDGWYRGFIGFSGQRAFYGDTLALLAQLVVTHSDGSKSYVTTDNNWRAATGPIRMSDIYNGEVYDATMEIQGWATASFDASKWQQVRSHSYPGEVLAQEGPFVEVIDTLVPIATFRTSKGELVYDFGQNLTGRVAFTAKGTKGDTLTISHAEVLDPDGNFYTANLRAAQAQIKYVFAGEGRESYAPHFTFMGFRYVRIEGVGEEALDIEAQSLHSAMAVTGSFSCSDSLINQLQHNIQWGQKGNFLDIPTDCPQRDERLGWTGDAQAFAKTAAFNMDVINFFRKWLADLAIDQTESGSVPWVIPNVLGENRGASTGWADAATIIPWDMYVLYGDRELLEASYPAMQKWVDYMVNEAGENHLWNTGFHFGDWLFFSPTDDRSGIAALTDKYLIAQSFFAHSVDLTRKAAKVLGKDADVRRYDALHQKVLEAYRKEYLTPSGRLVSSSQTAYVLALAFDLMPPALHKQAGDRLAENVRRYGHLTTGFLGTPMLCHELTEAGYPELAFQLLFRKEYPSWLYPVTKGATTIWERWDGIKPDGSFQNVGMNSFNHYAYGAIGDFLYRRVAGIQPLEEVPAYREFRLAPLLTDSLDQVSAYLETPYGKVASSWEEDGGVPTFSL